MSKRSKLDACLVPDCSYAPTIGAGETIMAKRNGAGIWAGVAALMAIVVVGLAILGDGAEETSIHAGMTGGEVLDVVSESCASSSEAVQRLLAEKTDQARETVLLLSSECVADSDAALDLIPASAWTNDHCRAYVRTVRDLAKWNISDGARLAQRPATGTLMSESDSNAGRRGLMLFEMADHHRDMCTGQRVVG